MSYSLYVHIPFCQQRCHYCDFNTYTGKDDLIPAYVDALLTELRVVVNFLDENTLHSIYFGGGTPSLVSNYEYEKLFDTIYKYFSLTSHCEISLEANPGTISQTYLTRLHTLGFNRISIGVQSTDSFDLTRLDRIHSIDDILKTIQYARQGGFGNINLDMIFNLPWQNLESWENSLSRAIDLSPEHFSLYALIIEPGTPLSYWDAKGLIAHQDEDLEAEMYERSMDMLKSAGYIHYEISNWAKYDPKMDYRCRHNMQYWLNLPYIGVGAGAHGYVGGNRTENVYSVDDYITLVRAGRMKNLCFPETPATLLSTKVDEQTKMKDFMWLGLRLVNEGVSVERFHRTFECSMVETFQDEIELLLGLGLVKWEDKNTAHLRLTERGVMLANQVFMQFV